MAGRYRRNDLIWYHTGQDLFAKKNAARFYAYNGNRDARIYVVNVGRFTVPLHTISKREAAAA